MVRVLLLLLILGAVNVIAEDKTPFPATPFPPTKPPEDESSVGCEDSDKEWCSDKQNTDWTCKMWSVKQSRCKKTCGTCNTEDPIPKTGKIFSTTAVCRYLQTLTYNHFQTPKCFSIGY